MAENVVMCWFLTLGIRCMPANHQMKIGHCLECMSAHSRTHLQKVANNNWVRHHNKGLWSKSQLINSSAVNEPACKVIQFVSAGPQAWQLLHLRGQSIPADGDQSLAPAKVKVAEVRASPLIQRLEQGLSPHKVRKLSLGHWNSLAAHVRLQIALTDLCEQATEAILDVAFALPIRVGYGQQPWSEEQAPACKLSGCGTYCDSSSGAPAPKQSDLRGPREI